jgi:ribosome-binding factor A
MSRRDNRIVETITHEAAIFIRREASGQSLITVTRTILSKNAERASVFVSVFPPEEARAALSFLSRLAGDFRGHLASHARLHPIPKIEFILDEGELNRQRLDELSKKS